MNDILNFIISMGKEIFYMLTHTVMGYTMIAALIIGLIINAFYKPSAAPKDSETDYLKGDPEVMTYKKCPVCGTNPVYYKLHTPICPFCRYSGFDGKYRKSIKYSEFWREYFNESVYDRYLKEYDRKLAESDPEYVETVNEKEQTDQDGITWKDNIINDGDFKYEKDEIMYVFDRKYDN